MDLRLRPYAEELPYDEHWDVVEVQRVGDTRVCIKMMIYTAAIITIKVGNDMWYEDRWCYATPAKAFLAAASWKVGVEPEPTGWHRHPASGRRREDGDPAKEYVSW